MVASPEVLAELAKSGLPQEAQAFLAAVSEGEVPTVAGLSAFSILYSGGTMVDPADANVEPIGRWRYWVASLSAFPTWKGAKLKNGLISTAAGFCQDTHTTFEDNAGFGITAFDPQSQIVFNWKLAQARFAQHTSTALLSVLQGTDSDRMLIPAYLGKTWPGGCDSGFQKRYAANLAALQAPQPTPAPPPTPEVITIPLPTQATDQAGKPVSLNWTMAAGAMVLMVGIGLSSAVMTAKPPATSETTFTEIPLANGPTVSPCVPGDLRALLVPSPCREPLSGDGR